MLCLSLKGVSKIVFHIKCPHCNEVQPFEMKDEDYVSLLYSDQKTIKLKCLCGFEWVSPIKEIILSQEPTSHPIAMIFKMMAEGGCN